MMHVHLCCSAIQAIIFNLLQHNALNCAQIIMIHLDNPETVDTFSRTLQANFLEVFQPHLITARCYRKL